MSRKNCDSPEIRWIRDMTPSGLPVVGAGASAMWPIQSRRCWRVTSAKVVMPGWCAPSHCPKTRTASSSFSTVEGASVSLRAASHFSATARIRGGSARGGFHDGISLRGWTATWPRWKSTTSSWCRCVIQHLAGPS
ncbi:hypothetical protein [Streptomyces sp. NPDC053431]|uniref:hypothetical protein n=1 Tax=Streptomyces sp. NPDC053431 TaxID=3365703 RepID=UPI0037CD77FF